jgi:predicted nucleic acid-binding protein
MSRILIDTSVWRRYFSGKLLPEHVRWMHRLLDDDQVILIHPCVTAELVLGGLSAGEERLLNRLPAATEVARSEVLDFIRARRLARRGIGWVDARLLASALVDTAALWAIDGPLQVVARELRIRFEG